MWITPISKRLDMTLRRRKLEPSHVCIKLQQDANLLGMRARVRAFFVGEPDVPTSEDATYGW
jgi:hypothetical protein